MGVKKPQSCLRRLCMVPTHCIYFKGVLMHMRGFGLFNPILLFPYKTFSIGFSLITVSSESKCCALICCNVMAVLTMV